MEVRAASRRAGGGELTHEAYGRGTDRFAATGNGAGSLDHLVEQGHWRAVAALSVRLEFGVPGRPQQLREAVLELVGAAGASHQAAQPLLADDDIPTRRDHAAVESPPGDVGQPFPVAGRRALLGDLE